MEGNETAHERMLKKLQLWVAVLAGTATLIVGAYNVKNIFFPKNEPVKVETPSKTAEPQSSPLRSAAEEAAASWLKKYASAKTDKS